MRAHVRVASTYLRPSGFKYINKSPPVPVLYSTAVVYVPKLYPLVRPHICPLDLLAFCALISALQIFGSDATLAGADGPWGAAAGCLGGEPRNRYTSASRGAQDG